MGYELGTVHSDVLQFQLDFFKNVVMDDGFTFVHVTWIRFSTKKHDEFQTSQLLLQFLFDLILQL